ncbi:hypothetical protein NITMOv2_4726 [Nitrospira moscoviensis]|uniref:Uncharacterized protein n=1 Tax=Nitrospira moscoviensis TaxID=42253 RepID=A0A0K2GJH3_NITMO|nr:hypothetical protein NITMOv2_4726 [Nitrospira moscoviensis]
MIVTASEPRGHAGVKLHLHPGRNSVHDVQRMTPLSQGCAKLDAKGFPDPIDRKLTLC